MLLIWAVLPFEQGFAQSIKITKSTTHSDLELWVKDASLEQILKRLGALYKFEVKSGTASARDERISTSYHGSLSQILQRLLRHRNHMIVQSGSGQKIHRVVLLNNTRAAPPAPVLAQTRLPSRKTSVKTQPTTNKSIQTARRNFKKWLLNKEQDAWLKDK